MRLLSVYKMETYRIIKRFEYNSWWKIKNRSEKKKQVLNKRRLLLHCPLGPSWYRNGRSKVIFFSSSPRTSLLQKEKDQEKEEKTGSGGLGRSAELWGRSHDWGQPGPSPVLFPPGLLGAGHTSSKFGCLDLLSLLCRSFLHVWFFLLFLHD